MVECKHSNVLAQGSKTNRTMDHECSKMAQCLLTFSCSDGTGTQVVYWLHVEVCYLDINYNDLIAQAVSDLKPDVNKSLLTHQNLIFELVS